MYTIDLLKGQGVPRKSTPGSIAAAAATAFVPVVIAIAMLGLYLRNEIVISIQASTITNYEKKTRDLSDAVKQQKAFEEEIKTYNNYLTEVSKNIDKHTQWSPVLVTVVENLPESVVLTSLEVKQRPVRQKVPKKDDPKVMVDVTIPVRNLLMTVAGLPDSNSDEEIKDFSDRLRSSELLGPKLENVRVSQGVGKLGDKEVISYQINCMFKPGM
jgi:Tfp pilus assembly protein PilN